METTVNLCMSVQLLYTYLPFLWGLMHVLL